MKETAGNLLAVHLALSNESPIWSVGDLARVIRRKLAREFPDTVWVSGEVSNYRVQASGHSYFSLKDNSESGQNTLLPCVAFRNCAARLPLQLADGMQVEAGGTLSLYEARGEVQLIVEAVRLAGQGAWLQQFLQWKEALRAEGLFDAARKRPLPAFPRVVGIVSSPQAAALRDVLVTLHRRAPQLRVRLYPAAVQGAKAPAQLVAALQRANAQKDVDALILCRGGGSWEDLAAFNDPALVRAIAASRLPVVCGVGHETDETLADYAADARAPTPTAAAELLTPETRDALLARLQQMQQRLARGQRRAFSSWLQNLDLLRARLHHPRQRLAGWQRQILRQHRRMQQGLHNHLQKNRWRLDLLAQRLCAPALLNPALRARQDRLTDLQRRLLQTIYKHLYLQQHQLALYEEKLEGRSPYAVLSRGYSLVRTEQGNVVCDSRTLTPGQRIVLRFAHGEARAQVESTGDTIPTDLG